jgi:hypothetical protein
MTSAVTTMAESLNARGKSWSERTTELLWEIYRERISIQDGIMAVTLFQQEAVAMSFCYMPETAKENWLVSENSLAESSHLRAAGDSEQRILLPSDGYFPSSDPATGRDAEDTAAEWAIPEEEWPASD